VYIITHLPVKPQPTNQPTNQPGQGAYNSGKPYRLEVKDQSALGKTSVVTDLRSSVAHLGLCVCYSLYSSIMYTRYMAK